MSFDKFTLADVRSAVNSKLSDEIDNATIDMAANDFQFELFNDNRIRFMEAFEELDVFEGDTCTDLPKNFMNLINMIVLDSDTAFRNLTKSGYLNYNDFMELFPNYTVATPSKILRWTFYGEGLRFQSAANADYTINIDFMRSPKLMVAATDKCELPINARELMTLGTLERIMRVNEDYPEAREELKHLAPLRTAFIRNYGRGGEKVGPQVIRTNRGRINGGYRVDRDFA